MKKLLYVWAIASVVAMFVSGCGDDVINVKNEDVYAVVESLSDTSCTKDNEGALAMVKSTKKIYSCKDGEWTPVVGADAVNLRCQSELLKDSSGYDIVCDGEKIGTVYNGQGEKGADGKDFLDQLKSDDLLPDSVKTIKDLLKYLKGENGENGEDGKDFLEELQKGNLVPDTVTTIEKLLEYLKGEKGDKGDNGASGSSCTAKANEDGSVTITCDGEEVGTIKNGNDGEAGTSCSGKANENGSVTISCGGKVVGTIENGKEGAPGASCTTKEVTDGIEVTCPGSESVVIKKGEDADGEAIKKELADKLACRVVDDEVETDEEKGIMYVPVQCGDDENNKTTLELPVYVKDEALLENLAKHYTKRVVLRVPFIEDGAEPSTSSSFAETYDFEVIWKQMKAGDVAELAVMELDANFEKTGKNFISNLTASEAHPFVTYEEVNGKTQSYKVIRLEGDIDVTNLVGSHVELRVSLNLKNDAFTSQTTYSALVDLSEESEDVVVDFLTDYKAARTKKLMSGDDAMTFDEASAQANGEVAEAFHLYFGKDAEIPTLESYLPNKTELNENQNALLLPAVLFYGNVLGFVNANTVYNKYKEVFADQGNLKGAVPGSINGVEYESMFLIDYVALILQSMLPQPDCGSSTHLNDDANYIKNYKIVQSGLIDAYDLEACNKNAVNQMKVNESGIGAFDLLICDLTC